MKMADILRNLADKLDGIEQSSDESNHPANIDQSAVDSPKGNPELDMNPVMVPPLQAKLELLKKATGVDSVYDDDSSDELGDIKKLTGIKAVIAQEAGEDNDITG
jgi:hypothetical protein